MHRGPEPDPNAPGHPWTQPGGQEHPPGPGPYHSQPPGWSAQPPMGSAFPPGYGPVPPPKRRRTALIIGLCVAAAIVVTTVGVVGVGLVTGTSSTQHGPASSHATATRTITLPKSAAGYTRMTGNVARRLVAASRQNAEKGAGTVSPAWAAAYAKAKIAFYRNGSAPPLVFIGFSATDTPSVAANLRSAQPSAALDSFFLGAGVSHTSDFPAGPLGGALRCGTTTRAATPVTMCAWTDSSVVALVAEAGTPKSKLAHVALAFRNASEH